MPFFTVSRRRRARVRCVFWLTGAVGGVQERPLEAVLLPPCFASLGAKVLTKNSEADIIDYCTLIKG